MNTRRPRLIHLTTVPLSLRVLLAFQLRRFGEEGYDVIGMSAPGTDVAAIEAMGVRHVAVPHLTRRWSPFADVRALWELVRLFRQLRPDIVHTHNPKSGVLGRVAARLARVPVIVNTVHGLYAGPAMPPVKRAIASRAERWAARLSHHEFFQSAEDLRYAIASRMVPARRASLLGNGVDLARFDPGRVDQAAVRELRTRWDAARGGPVVVGSVGRLVREKGFIEFLEAARQLGEKGRDLRFVVVGPEEPDKEDRLSEAEVASGRAAGVVFHGEGNDMPSIYTAFDVFVLPSHREGMPRSAIEASAMRRPVVATDIRGCREVVDDGVTGSLVPPRDPAALAAAIDDVAGDANLRERFGAAGRTRALQRFDEQEVVGRCIDVYRDVAAERAPR